MSVLYDPPTAGVLLRTQGSAVSRESLTAQHAGYRLLTTVHRATDEDWTDPAVVKSCTFAICCVKLKQSSIGDITLEIKHFCSQK